MTLPALDVRDLMGHPGTSRVAAMTGTVEGLKTEVASVPDDAPVQGELLLESIVEGILVSGRVAGTGTCRACGA